MIKNPHIQLGWRSSYNKKREKWTLENEDDYGYCEAIMVEGHHQYKRVKRNHHYIEECRRCGKPLNPPKNRHEYKTTLGILEGRGSDEESLDLYLESLPPHSFADYDLWSNPVSDLGTVYDLTNADGGKMEAPTGVLSGKTRTRVRGVTRRLKKPLRGDSGKRVLERQVKARTRLGRKREKAREFTRVRSPVIASVVRRINDYCRENQIGPDKLSEALRKIYNCMVSSDGYVFSKGGKITDHELMSLASGATYHYLQEFLTQLDAVGSPESIFPDLTRPTLSTWRDVVEIYDAGKL